MPDATPLDPPELVDHDELRRVLGLTFGTLHTEASFHRVAAAASDYVAEYLDAAAAEYAQTPAVREAALAVAVELWKQRVAPGGGGGEFAPAPFALGNSLLRKVQGLLAPYLSTGHMIG